MPDFNDFKDKIPSVKELVDNGKKAAETYERNPTGSFVWIILVLCVGLCLYLGWQNNKLQEQLNDMALTAFNQAMLNTVQRETIKVQKEAMRETKQTLQDSIDAVNVKNFNGEIKIKK